MQEIQHTHSHTSGLTWVGVLSGPAEWTCLPAAASGPAAPGGHDELSSESPPSGPPAGCPGPEPGGAPLWGRPLHPPPPAAGWWRPVNQKLQTSIFKCQIGNVCQFSCTRFTNHNPTDMTYKAIKSSVSVWPLTSGAWSSTGVMVMLKRRPETVPPWWSLTEKMNWTNSCSGPMSSTGGMKATFLWFTACWRDEDTTKAPSFIYSNTVEFHCTQSNQLIHLCRWSEHVQIFFCQAQL